MSLLFNGENIKKFRKWMKLLSLSVSQSSPDAYPFRSQKSIGFSRKKQSKTLEEFSLGWLVSPTAFPFRSAKSKHFSTLQKMPKNYENARQLVTDCHRFKVGDKLSPSLQNIIHIRWFLSLITHFVTIS